MNQIKEIWKAVNYILLAIGIIANLLAIALLPKVGPLVLFTIFSITVLFVVGKIILNEVRKRSFAVKYENIPSLLIPHKISDSDGLEHSLKDDGITALKEIKLASLKLLLLDQLDTGGWAKTYFWRLRQKSQPVPPLGTLTGTNFVMDSISASISSPGLEIPRLGILKDRLESLLNKDGTYFREHHAITHGRTIFRPEDLRHTAAGFMIRSLFLERNQKDILTIRWMLGKIQGTSFDDLEYLDLSFALKAFLTAMYIFGKGDFQLSKSLRKACQKMFSYIANSVDQYDDIQLLWGPRKPSLTAGDPVFQWTVIWNLLPYLQESLRLRIQKDDASKVVLAIKTFIEQTLNYRRNPGELLPSGYSVGQPRLPEGESVYGTAMAITIHRYLRFIDIRKNISGDSEDHIKKTLVEKLVKKGSLIATRYALRLEKESPEILEGFLGWASLLFACKTLGLEISREEMDWAGSVHIDSKINGMKLSNDFVESINEASKTLNSLLNGTRVKLDENGYYNIEQG